MWKKLVTVATGKTQLGGRGGGCSGISSSTEIIPKCSHMDPPIIGLQLSLMNTLIAYIKGTSVYR